MNANMRKQVLTFLMVLVMIVSLVGCGGKSSPVGTYELITWSSEGVEMSVQDVAALFEMDVDISLELKDDNSFTLDMGFLTDGEAISGNWKMDGDSLILSSEGEELSVTYDGKTIVLDVDGEIFTFGKQ